MQPPPRLAGVRGDHEITAVADAYAARSHDRQLSQVARCGYAGRVLARERARRNEAVRRSENLHRLLSFRSAGRYTAKPEPSSSECELQLSFSGRLPGW